MWSVSRSPSANEVLSAHGIHEVTLWGSTPSFQVSSEFRPTLGSREDWLAALRKGRELAYAPTGNSIGSGRQP